MEGLRSRDLVIAQLRSELEELHNRSLRNEKLTSLGMLAAGIAHEINNPMCYVTSNVRSLADELKALPSLPDPLREYVDEVLPATLDGIKRVNTIVADLRTFARDDAGAAVEFDLNEQVEAALRIAHGHLVGKVQVSKQLARAARARGRPQQITQVFVNLLVNAAQAITGEGQIVVTTRCDPDELIAEVRDTGSGMSSETIQRVFQPFFSTKPVGVGTGLGLAVAHGIVRRHGGRMEVRSQLGVGTTFAVHLPRSTSWERVSPAAGTSRQRGAA
jgi:signal transduction histidine kinase